MFLIWEKQLKNLKNMIWYSAADVDTFYPRWYNLKIPEEYDDFILDYKLTKAEGVVKKYMSQFDGVAVNIKEEKLLACLDVLER